MGYPTYLNGMPVSGGGGSGGGHTIIDDNGDALTQRANLQFAGAYSEDDSTNDASIVNIARKMTMAEFNALSADEKKGFIQITDEDETGCDTYFHPIIYSTDERRVGVWVDGKPLYQKTKFSTSTLSYNTLNTVSLGVSDVDKFVSVTGFVAYGNDANFIPLPYGDRGNSNVCIAGINADSGEAKVWIGSDYQAPNTVNLVVITIQYTKTTDVLGLGDWTPQGVPSVHYSTDEQVIGTWLGETLYQKTIEIPSISSSSPIEIDLSSLNMKDFIDARGRVACYSNGVATEVLYLNVYSFASNYTGQMRYLNNKLQIYHTHLNEYDSGYVTIQYTKVS